MRKLLISLLLAGAAASPALADPGDHNDHRQARAEHQQMRMERQQSRSEGQAQFNGRPQFNGRAQFNGMANGGGQQQQFARAQFQQNVQAVPQGGGDQAAEFRAERQRFRAQHQFQGQVNNEGLRQPDRQFPNVMRTHNRSPMVGEIPRDRSRWASGGWDRDWRRDHRYDWRNYRDRHRSIFHLGFYYDPFGYAYQPFAIGFQLMPAYYGRTYWIDPGLYDLPFPPPGTQWVRYWNDAVLVDVYTGEVIDVIRGFFW